MTSAFETSVMTVITVAIFYYLLAILLTFTWNRSVSKIFTTPMIDVVEALLLLLTMNILFGTFSQAALHWYSNYANKFTNKLSQEYL